MDPSLTGGFFVAAADVLALGARLSGASELAAADVLRRRIRTLLDQFEVRAREAGGNDADVRDARYALVAFLDEQILKAPWSGRQQWMIEPLQLSEYGENTAGEGFFTRLDAIAEDRRRAHVAQVYHLCICLGFQGKYAIRGADALNAVAEQLAAQLAPALAVGDVPSPHGEPLNTRARQRGRELPLVGFGAFCLVGALVLFVVLRVTIGGRATEVSRGFDDQAKAGSTAPGAAPSGASSSPR